MQRKSQISLIIFLLLTLFFSKTTFSLACLSITDDFNSTNPVQNANFDLLPDVGPFTDCWSGAFRIRTSRNFWRLVANRHGPFPTGAMGDSQDYIRAHDIALNFKVDEFGNAKPDGAILVSPFSSETDLSSVGTGTLVVSGVKRSGISCSPNNPNFYQLKKKLCLFQDFVFNVGQYNGEVSYVLVAP